LERPASGACPPAGWDATALDRLRAAQFVLDDAARREALATALLDCLADPRPQLRDEIAFEALSAWLRGGMLTVAQHHALLRDLSQRLTAEDAAGFGRPFAALALAELARADRLSPWLAAPERDALVRAATAYLRGVHDYRGFDASQGWRHGVAHGADLLMQLALNPALSRDQVDAIVQAVGVQVAPAGTHFYIYGEGERLARPILFVAQRGLHEAADWSAWLAALAQPAPGSSWRESLRTQEGLARKHNTQAFMQVLYVMVRESGSEALQRRLLPGLLDALKALP
jgi:hypothetical protein